MYDRISAGFLSVLIVVLFVASITADALKAYHGIQLNPENTLWANDIALIFFFTCFRYIDRHDRKEADAAKEALQRKSI
jgi:hypothetical protein